VYFINSFNLKCDSLNANYKEIKFFSQNSDIAVYRRTNLNGILLSIREGKKEDEKIHHGIYVSYYDNFNINTHEIYFNGLLEGPFYKFHKNGIIEHKGSYTEGKLNDSLKTYYPDGKTRRSDFYNKDSLVHGNCFTNNGSDTTYFPFRIEATFPGGEVGMKRYIAENIIYPTISIEMNEQGRVYLSFIVEKNGKISDITVLRGVSKEIDFEATRVIKSMPNWEPGKIDGYPVRTRLTLPINFTLDSPSKKERKFKKKN
jgi:TonB family protein